MRADPTLVGTKILIVSAKAMTSERLEGYAAGANDYVVKPFDPDELIAKVRVYLRLKSVEEVDGLKSDLLKLLSHETATPLTGIFGALGLLRDSDGVTAEQLELIDVADSSVERLHGLVKRVCLITQLKAGTVPIRRQPEELHSLSATAIEEMGECAQKAGVVLTLEPGDDVPVVGDRSLLGWVIEAMLDNAIRLSPRTGAVNLRVWTDGERASLSVSDDGPGIEAELVPRMFDEFVVAKIKHHRKGSGLSLAAARLIAEQHGGTVSVQSEAGHGATFRLDIGAVPTGRAVVAAA
jgi:signal transduction histidine kinase